MRTWRNSPATTGFSFVEILVALFILVAAGIPLYNVMGLTVRGVERTRDEMIAFAIAEKLQEQINDLMRGNEADRKAAIDFEIATETPVTELPFFPELKAAVEQAVAAAPAAKTGDPVQALSALAGFKCKVLSTTEEPNGSPEATFLTKQIEVSWRDATNKRKAVTLSAYLSNASIYYEAVKPGYANAKSITDVLMQQVLDRANQQLVKIDASSFLDSLQYPLKSNEFVEPDPWYEGYMQQARGVSINRRLGTAGQTSDERMAVKEAALAQFMGLNADQAAVIVYDLKNEAEAIVKQVKNLPSYSETFKDVKGVAGVGVRNPGQPGAYSCLNCHAPQFFATLDEGYLSLPAEFLSYKPEGQKKTGAEWLDEYLVALRDKKAISPAEYTKFSNNLRNKDVGIFSGATSGR
jgi:Tfp pilus assembly protein PilV